MEKLLGKWLYKVETDIIGKGYSLSLEKKGVSLLWV